MPDGQKGATIIQQLLDMGLGYLWFFVLALWGGTVSYINRVRKMKTAFSLVELIGEWSISGFVGLITAYICAEMGFSFYMTAALTGIAGHMGGRAIFILEKWFHQKAFWMPSNGENKPCTGDKDEEHPLREKKNGR